MSDNVLVALPEEVSLALLEEGPGIAEEVIQPRGPVLDVALQVLDVSNTFVSLVVGLPAVIDVLKKLTAWRRKRPNASQTIDIRIGDGFTLNLKAGADGAALNDAAELVLRHLERARSAQSPDRRFEAEPTGRDGAD